MSVCEQERTLHILCQLQPDLTPDSVRLKLASWVPSHFAWIKSVGKAFLDKKKKRYYAVLGCVNMPKFHL